MPLTKATYSMINGAAINVLDFGADLTGVADSASAIQAAFNATLSTGGTVYFPYGTYKVGTTLKINKHNQVIYGNNSIINFTGTGFAIDSDLVGGTIFPQYLQMQDFYIACGATATGGVKYRFSYGVIKNVTTQIISTNQIGWFIDSNGTGAYYNLFENCGVNGFTNGTTVVNQKGFSFESGVVAPNANVFIGGRISAVKLPWAIYGYRNLLLGVTVEGTANSGTVFTIGNTAFPLSTGYNQIVNPYLEGGPGTRVYNIETGYYNKLDNIFATSMAGGPASVDNGIGTTIMSEYGYKFPDVERIDDPQTLDWYEEGVWTPTLSASGGGSATYTTQQGSYTEVGNRMYIQGYILLSGVGTLSGNLAINVPLIAAVGVPQVSPINFSRATGITLAGASVITAEITMTATSMSLYGSTLGTGAFVALTAATLSNTTEIAFSGFYEV